MSNDELDPEIWQRFAELDGVDPPDTWNAVWARDVTPLAPRRGPWRPLAYAAAGVALIGGIVLASTRNADEIPDSAGHPESTTFLNVPFTTTIPGATSPVDMQPVPTGAIGTTSTSIPFYATASAFTIGAGFPLTITPPGDVVRICGDVVLVIDVYGEVVGQILADDQWVSAGDGASACGAGSSADPRTVIVPDIPDGPYKFCISEQRDERGCVDIQIQSGFNPTSTSTTVPWGPATASADVVRVDDQLTITPAQPIERNCTNIVTVGRDGESVGLILDGNQWVPTTPGAPTTWPACIGETTGEPISVAVPPVESGVYTFCIGVSYSDPSAVCVEVEVI